MLKRLSEVIAHMLRIACLKKPNKNAPVSLSFSCQTDRRFLDELLVIQYCSILIVLYLFPYGDPAESQCNPTYVCFFSPLPYLWHLGMLL